MNHTTLAPPGWGYRPGAPMEPCSVERMPDLPFLGLIRNRKHRHRAVTEAIRAAGIDINTLTPPHLVKRYGMRQDEASKIVQVAQGVMP